MPEPLGFFQDLKAELWFGHDLEIEGWMDEEFVVAEEAAAAGQPFYILDTYALPDTTSMQQA